MIREFCKTILKLAKKDPKIFLITGDVEQEITEYKKLFPKRYLNLGLTEQYNNPCCWNGIRRL